MQHNSFLEGRDCVTRVSSLASDSRLVDAQQEDSAKWQVLVSAPVTPALSFPPFRHAGGEADGESGVCLDAPFSFEEKSSVES